MSMPGGSQTVKQAVDSNSRQPERDSLDNDGFRGMDSCDGWDAGRQTDRQPRQLAQLVCPSQSASAGQCDLIESLDSSRGKSSTGSTSSRSTASSSSSAAAAHLMTPFCFCFSICSISLIY